MAKPWGKYEIDYLDHPKFRALNGNAIVLWLEAKNHCDKFQTDGRFPLAIAKTFRYFSAKAVELLSRSCGVKPNGDAYAALWVLQDIGGVGYYVMHDYLDHNDCREAVLERMADAEQRAELRRLRDRERKQRERETRKSELDRLRNVHGTSADSAERPPLNINSYINSGRRN